jgi:hypothetical protein
VTSHRRPGPVRVVSHEVPRLPDEMVSDPAAPLCMPRADPLLARAMRAFPSSPIAELACWVSMVYARWPLETAMDAETERFVEAVLEAAEGYDVDVLERASEVAAAEAAEHRQQEEAHRRAAEEAELMARRLTWIRRLKSGDVVDPGAPALTAGRAAPATDPGSPKQNQAALVRRAIASRGAGRKVAPKEIFDQLKAEGAAVTSSNVQLQMGRLADKGRLRRLERGEYEIQVGGS